jgi:hypothetical protein
MHLTAQIAKQFRDVHFGGNWTAVNLKDTVADITWQQATTEVNDFNTIATLVFHTNYYVGAVMKLLLGGPLDASDKFSFALPPIACSEDWDQLLNKVWREAEAFASLVEQLPEAKLWDDFADGKYGNYYRNITGIIEHLHYHLGQIVLIKKMLPQADAN